MFSVSSFSQCKEDIIFIFNENNTDVYRQNDSVYVLNDLVFRFESRKHNKRKIEYDSIKEKTISIKKFKERTIDVKFPESYNRYNFYLYFRKNNKQGNLLEVERIWIVEDIIID